MADGLLGGIGDFFLGGGRYADPNAINPQYGVPEADVRQAGINTLANVSALLLAAGQPMSGQQRAQLLAGVGPALGGMQSDIFKASQARLMNAQQRASLQELQEVEAINKRRQEDPAGLARAMKISEDLVKTLDARSLRDVAKQITIKQATKSPLEQFVERETAAALGAVQGQPAVAAAPPAAAAAQTSAPSETPPAAGAPQTAQAAAAAAAPAPQVGDPQRQRYVEQLRQLAARISIADPERAKKLVENADLIESSSLKQARQEIGKLEGTAAASAPTSVGFADETLRLIDELKKNPGLQYVTGNVYGRAGMPVTYLPGEFADQARNAQSVIQQLQGRSFLEAYRTALKGAGPVTEKEGAKGETAIARLQQTFVKTEDYIKALNDFEDAVKKLRQGAVDIGQRYGTIPKQAESSATAPPTGQPRIRRWNPQTGTLE